MANTKYTLCTNLNQPLMVESLSAMDEELSIIYEGKIYDSIEEFDANEMPKEIFASKPNVVAAFAGTKITGGIDTGEPCLVIGVHKKIDPSALHDDDKIPSVLPDGVITDIIEMPKIRSFGTCTDGGGGGCYPHDEKHRPLVGGISAMEESGTACTLGLIVKDSSNNNLVALTNNHCVGLLYNPSFKTPTYGSLSVAGNNMMQPSPSDGGIFLDIYGSVVRAIALEFGTDSTQNNIVDCAISSIGIDDASTSILQLHDGPYPFAISSEYLVGTELYKSGRTTGNTPPPTITITSKNALVNVSYGPPGAGDEDTAPFTNQIIYTASTRFTQGGDSGSAMVALIDGTYKVIGLHFAGNDTGTLGVGCPIESVASELNIEAWDGDIVVAECSSPSIMVDGVCYERVGTTSDSITHTLDDEFSDCYSCAAQLDVSSSSETIYTSSSSDTSILSASSSSSETPSSESTHVLTSSESSSSQSSHSSSSVSSSSDSSSTEEQTTSTSSDITASSSSSEFEDLFVDRHPDELSVQVSSNNRIFLSWKRLYKASGYVIERKEGFSDWESLVTVTSTSYIDSGLVPGKYYRYRVRGYLDV